MIRTHKGSGWTRTALGQGYWRITPTDGSGERIVAMLSRGDWQNLPNDDRRRQWQDRAVLVSGAILPDWAILWLEQANHRASVEARHRLADMMRDADVTDDRREM